MTNENLRGKNIKAIDCVGTELRDQEIVAKFKISDGYDGKIPFYFPKEKLKPLD